MCDDKLSGKRDCIFCNENGSDVGSSSLFRRINSPVFKCKGVSGSKIGFRKEMKINMKKRKMTNIFCFLTGC